MRIKVAEKDQTNRNVIFFLLFDLPIITCEITGSETFIRRFKDMAEDSVENHSSIRMMRFYMQAVGMWTMKTKRDKILANFALTYTILAMAIALVTVIVDFVYCWGDLRAITYNTPCTTTVLLELLKLLMFLFNRQKVMDFNVFTENTFWKIKYELVDLSILNKCNKQTMRMNVVLAVLMQMIAWHYLTIPMIASYGKNSSERTLPFKMWFNLPFTETPWWEITYALQAVGCLSVSICSTSFASFLFTICSYACGQFKILQRRLECCCDPYAKSIVNDLNVKDSDSKIYSVLKECIKQHQILISYMEKVEDLYCYIMMGATLGAVSQICFSGFQVLLGAAESIQRTFLSLEFLGGAIIILYLFSWACHEIIDESTAVAEAACRASWYILPHEKWGKAYRNAVLMIIIRARKPCILTVGKFAPMSLVTFMSVFNTSISYFTILRNFNEEE